MFHAIISHAVDYLSYCQCFSVIGRTIVYHKLKSLVESKNTYGEFIQQLSCKKYVLSNYNVLDTVLHRCTL